MSHEAVVRTVPDTRGYTIGYACECECGWLSDLHDRQTQALMDLQNHLNTTRED